MEMNRTRATALAAAALAAAGSAGIAGVMTASSKDKSKQTQSSAQGYRYGMQGRPGDGRGPQGGPGRGGRHGERLSSSQLSAIAKKLGVTGAQLKAAITAAHQANKPKNGEKPDDHRGPGKGDIAEELATALGVSEDDVEKMLEANRPDRSEGRPKPGERPDSSALVSALAKGLGKDEATVKAALDKVFAAKQADRTDHRDAEFAAIAKKLGLEAADVKAAFEAVLPKRVAPSP